MPAVSEKQRRAMWAAAEGHSTLGIPEKVGKEYVGSDALPHAPGSGHVKKDALASAISDAISQPAQGITELDVAKAIRAGELPSPQQYENIWLFDVRVTGTGTSYRQAIDEYVYRPPENFLTPEFVERCNGLPVVFEHPKDSILDTEEYRERAVGSVVLPYIKGDEVWGIAKIYDADAAQLMRTTHASTSPAVVFRDAGSTETVDMGGGSVVLIEGKPSYLDHLAICREGVWDKGGGPTGITNEDSAMADENMAPAWADELGKKFDAVCSRLDALENKGSVKTEEDAKEEEEKKADAEGDGAEKEGEKEEREEKAAEKEIKAAEEEGEKEMREDARADAQSRENAELRKLIASMNARLNRATQPLSAADRDELAKTQARADSLAQMFGDSVTPPLAGETPIEYRRRMAAKFQKHSAGVKNVKLDALDAESFGVIEGLIYSDAQAAAMKPGSPVKGRLIAIKSTDEAGRTITRYQGDMDAWLAPFKAPGMRVAFRQSNGAR
jgi:hypothetical protein